MSQNLCFPDVRAALALQLSAICLWRFFHSIKISVHAKRLQKRIYIHLITVLKNKYELFIKPKVKATDIGLRLMLSLNSDTDSHWTRFLHTSVQILYKIHEVKSFLRSEQSLSRSRNSSSFMEPEGSLPC
jgi:hypothetical protein